MEQEEPAGDKPGSDPPNSDISEQVIMGEPIGTQVLPVENIPVEERVVITVPNPRAAGIDISRTVRIPEEKAKFQGYLEIRRREAKSLMQSANRIKVLTAKGSAELQSFEIDELKIVYRNDKTSYRGLRDLETTMEKLVAEDSLEDWTNIMSVAHQALDTRFKVTEAILNRVAKEAQEQEDESDDEEEEEAGGGQGGGGNAANRTTRDSIQIGTAFSDESITKMASAMVNTKISVTKEDLKRIKWSGKTSDYQRFENNVYQMFGKSETIPDWRKMLYMADVLPDMYAKLPDRYKQEKTGYNELWAYLRKRYARETDQVQAQVQILKDLHTVYKNSSNLYDDEKFCDFVAKARIALNELNRLGRRGKDHHEEWLKYLTPKIDSDLATPFLELYEEKNRWKGDTNTDPMDEFLDYLERKQLANHDQIANKKLLNKSNPSRAQGSKKKGGKKKGTTPPEVQNYNVQGEPRGNWQPAPTNSWQQRGQGGNQPHGAPRGNQPQPHNRQGGGQGGAKGATANQGPPQTYIPSYEELAKCCFCSKTTHRSDKCDQMGQPNTWWGKVYRAKACPVCFTSFHLVNDCKKLKKCNIDGCSKWHHPAIHNGVHIPYAQWRRNENQKRNQRGGSGRGRGRGGGGRGRGGSGHNNQ